MSSILVVVDVLDLVNGVSITYRELAKFWAEKLPNHDLYIFGSGSQDKLIHISQNVTFQIASSRYKLSLSLYDDLQVHLPILALLRLLRTGEFDLVHFATPGPMCLIGMYYAAIRHLKVIATHHTRFDIFIEYYFGGIGQRLAKTIFQYLARRLYSQAIITLAHSPDAADDAKRVGATKSIYVPMGVAFPVTELEIMLELKSSARERLIRRLGLNIDTPILIYVGRLSQEKEISVLLSAACVAKTTILFAGDGPLSSMVKEHRFGTFLGLIRDKNLDEIYFAADLLISASHSETLGRVFLEALAHGTPILVPKIGYHMSVLTRQCDAIFCYSKQPEHSDCASELSQAILRFVNTKMNRTLLAETAFNFALDYRWDKIINQHVEAYEQAIKLGELT